MNFLRVFLIALSFTAFTSVSSIPGFTHQCDASQCGVAPPLPNCDPASQVPKGLECFHHHDGSCQWSHSGCFSLIDTCAPVNGDFQVSCHNTVQPRVHEVLQHHLHKQELCPAGESMVRSCVTGGTRKDAAGSCHFEHQCVDQGVFATATTLRQTNGQVGPAPTFDDPSDTPAQ